MQKPWPLVVDLARFIKPPGPLVKHQYLDPAEGTICGVACFRKCFLGDKSATLWPCYSFARHLGSGKWSYVTHLLVNNQQSPVKPISCLKKLVWEACFINCCSCVFHVWGIVVRYPFKSIGSPLFVLHCWRVVPLRMFDSKTFHACLKNRSVKLSDIAEILGWLAKWVYHLESRSRTPMNVLVYHGPLLTTPPNGREWRSPFTFTAVYMLSLESIAPPQPT